MTQKNKKKKQEIREYFHKEIQDRMHVHDAFHEANYKVRMKAKRNSRTFLIDNNLWNVNSIIKEYNSISVQESKLPSTVRKFVSELCTKAYASTHTHFNPQLNALKNKSNV